VGRQRAFRSLLLNLLIVSHSYVFCFRDRCHGI
jgi:hypothetical protein